jgi:hypothetical protein
MKIKTVEFVEASDIFRDCPQMWEVFLNSSPDCSWGDNNRSMVTKDVIIEALEKTVDRESSTQMDDEASPKEIEEVFLRLDSLPENMLIDMEN